MFCAISNIGWELDRVTSKSSNKYWLHNIETEIVQFDNPQLDCQANTHARTTNEDSISTFAFKNPTTSETYTNSNINVASYSSIEATLNKSEALNATSDNLDRESSDHINS